MDTTITENLVETPDEIERTMAARELGDAIKRLRVQSGWTQKQLGKKIGLYQTGVSDIESGAHTFPLETVYRLANAFKINPFELAAIYWGIELSSMPDKEKELLNNLLRLFDEYRSTVTIPTTTTVEPANPQAYLGLEEAKAEGKRRSRAAKKEPAPNHHTADNSTD